MNKTRYDFLMKRISFLKNKSIIDNNLKYHVLEITSHESDENYNIQLVCQGLKSEGQSNELPQSNLTIDDGFLNKNMSFLVQEIESLKYDEYGCERILSNMHLISNLLLQYPNKIALKDKTLSYSEQINPCENIEDGKNQFNEMQKYIIDNMQGFK